ncbi:uncharacterized protein LOC122947312 [Acropora millepora]|uniref:uncharacterized protein LOC122947312 n=1 Tax=Acropora millepora TaxID=45264 RepID=UPI001CF3EDF3|nr:uncharacterized protein LOC122947312 [Acropora millepora]
MEKDKSGNGTAKKQWKYFSKSDIIISEKHIVSPPCIVDVMADTSQGNLKDTADDLVQKYGQGEVSIQKCETCNYEKIIHSSGVHHDEGGCVKVYSEDHMKLVVQTVMRMSPKILRTPRKSLKLVIQIWLNCLRSQWKTLPMKRSPKLSRRKIGNPMLKSL